MNLLVLSGIALAADPAVPQLDADLFHMSVDGGVGLGLDDASRLPNRTLQARAVLDYVNDPLVYQYESGERVEVLSDLLALDLLAGYTLGPVRLGVELPVYLVTASELADGGFSLGDVGLDAKIGLLDPAETRLGLAAVGRLLLPSGANDIPVGAPGVGGEVGLAASTRVEDWRLALNLGTRQIPTTTLEEVDWGSQFTYRAGVAKDLGERAGASLELGGASVYRATGPGSNPVELMASGWYKAKPGVTAHLGLGTGVTRGVGAPLARVVAGVSFGPDEVRDRDKDGIADRVDACVDVPEDLDGFQDTEGCPDPDNDGDTILDLADACINEAEDRDGFQDTEGCPDPDNDADGLVDVQDKCPDQKEDKDSWLDEDGCPDPETEVRIRFVDEAGAPIPGVVANLDKLAGGTEFNAKTTAGRHELSAKASGYYPLVETIDVKDGPPLLLTRTLKAEPDVGTIDVRVQTTDGKPLRANVAIGANAPAAVPDGHLSAKMKPGGWDVHVTADGFASTTQKVTLSKGGTSSVVVVLQPAKVVVQKENIQILDKIYFDTNKATIKKVSFPLLKEIATVLKEHPELTSVRVEGHTDSRGNDASNLKLSDARAKAVRDFLVKEGVAKERLDAAGFGETRPVEAAENEAAWEKNRRVEFVIVSRAEPRSE